MTIDNMNELKSLVKQTLGIVDSATAKDGELELLITAGVEDMTRAGALVDTTDALVQKAILTYVKANFGVSNPTDKERFLKSYQLCLAELTLSEGYKEAEVDAGLDN
jgi:hypothetical protein